MTTLADLVLKVAREVTDVMDGAATAGTASSLTDTNTLTQPHQYWDRGIVFFRSGTHAGKALPITGYANSKITFASLGATPIAAADRYAVTRGAFPWSQIVSAIGQALEATHVTGDDSTLTGDGATLSFPLPNGVYNIKRVEFTRAGTNERLRSNHWREVNGELWFDFGYAPINGDTIHAVYRKAHPELAAYGDVLSTEINEDWLKYKAAEQLLWWAVGMYGAAPEYRIEERMNKIIGALKNRLPRRDGPDIVLRTVGV